MDLRRGALTMHHFMSRAGVLSAHRAAEPSRADLHVGLKFQSQDATAAKYTADIASNPPTLVNPNQYK